MSDNESAPVKIEFKKKKRKPLRQRKKSDESNSETEEFSIR